MYYTLRLLIFFALRRRRGRCFAFRLLSVSLSFTVGCQCIPHSAYSEQTEVHGASVRCACVGILVSAKSSKKAKHIREIFLLLNTLIRM